MQYFLLVCRKFWLQTNQSLLQPVMTYINMYVHISCVFLTLRPQYMHTCIYFSFQSFACAKKRHTRPAWTTSAWGGGKYHKRRFGRLLSGLHRSTVRGGSIAFACVCVFTSTPPNLTLPIRTVLTDNSRHLCWTKYHSNSAHNNFFFPPHSI